MVDTVEQTIERVRTPAPLSAQEYKRLHPLNKRHRWLINRISATRMVPALAERMPTQLCTVSLEAAGLRVTRLPDCPAGTPAGPDAILHLLQALGSLRIRPVAWGTAEGQRLEANEDGYRVDGREATARDVLSVVRIMSAAQRCVITTERVRTPPRDLVRVYLGRAKHRATVLQMGMLVAAEDRHDQQADTASLPLGLVRTVEDVFSDPEARFRFISADLLVESDGTWSLEDLATEPRYPDQGFTEQARRFLGQRARRRRERELELARELQDAPEPVTSAERRFAQRHGFSPDTVRRFGIDRDNVHRYVSERDYLGAQPFNDPAADRALNRLGADGGHCPAEALYSIRQEGKILRIRPLAGPYTRSDEAVSDVVDAVHRVSGAMLGPAVWNPASLWRVDVPDAAGDSARADVLVNGIGYSADEFELLLRAMAAEQPVTLSAGGGRGATPQHFSTDDSVQIRVTMIREQGEKPYVADAFVVGHHHRRYRKEFRKAGQLVGTEQTRWPGASTMYRNRDTSHEAAEAHMTAGRRAGVEVWPEGLRDLGGVDLVGRIYPETGRVESGRAMVGTELYEYILHPVTQQPLRTTINGWDALVADLERRCESSPQLSFVEYTAVINSNGHQILGCSLTPQYPVCYRYSAASANFIKRAAKAHKK